MKIRVKRIIEQVVFFILLIAIWQVAYVISVDGLEVMKSYAVPSPLGVWDSAVNLLESNVLVLATINSMGRCLIGFGIAIVMGMIFGLAINMSDFLHRNLKPVILGIQTLPSICWVPFAILWYGLEGSAIIFVVVMGSAFSLSIAVDSAIRNVNPIYIKVSKTMGASNMDLYRRVIFPACLPSLVSGLKQTWSFAWRALMSGEVMVTCVGLGTTLQTARDFSDINQVMLVMIVITLLGVLIDKSVFSTWEKHILRQRGL